MSEQPGGPDQPRTCPSCGAQLPAEARYCPNCGTRMPEPAGGVPSFEEAIADVLGAPEPDEVGPPTTIPLPPTPPPAVAPPDEGTWTATPLNWSATPGSWDQSPPVGQMVEVPGNRTMWIILAVLGFLWFCCCGTLAVAFMVDGAG